MKCGMCKFWEPNYNRGAYEARFHGMPINSLENFQCNVADNELFEIHHEYNDDQTECPFPWRRKWAEVFE